MLEQLQEREVQVYNVEYSIKLKNYVAAQRVDAKNVNLAQAAQYFTCQTLGITVQC